MITYKARSAVRDMGRALGTHPVSLDAWSKQVDAWGRVEATVEHDIPSRSWSWPGRSSASPPPRHPLRRHGDLRPAGGRGLPGRVAIR